MKFSNFATDLDLEEKGVWVDLGEGTRLKLARIGNPAYKKLMREKLKPYRTQSARAGISDQKWSEINCDVLSKTVLLDWEGWEDDKDKPVKYSQKHAYDMLMGLKDFRAMVVELADQQATFAMEVQEEAGNG
jgi:hypothetical protein